MATLPPPIDSPVVVLREGRAWAHSYQLAGYSQQQHGHFLEKRRKLEQADPAFAAENFRDEPYRAPSGRMEPGVLITAAALKRMPFRAKNRGAIARYIEALENRSPELAQTVAASFGLPPQAGMASPEPEIDEDPDLPPLDEPVVLADGMRVYCTTLDIAAFFRRRHKDVLVIVRDIIAQAQDFAGPNFRPFSALGANGKKVPAYEVTEEGFTIIVGRFSGPEALAFQIRYITRFKEMEAALKAQTLPPPDDDGLHPDAPRDYESSLEALLAKHRLWKQERADRLAAEQRALTAEQEKAALAQVNAEVAQRAADLSAKMDIQARFLAAYAALHNAQGLTLVSDLAKVLHIPRGEMFKRLHAAGYIFQRAPGKPWLAYDKWVRQGLFDHTIFTQTLDDGTKKDRPQLYATRKGVERIALLFGTDDDGPQGRFAFGCH